MRCNQFIMILASAVAGFIGPSCSTNAQGPNRNTGGSDRRMAQGGSTSDSGACPSLPTGTINDAGKCQLDSMFVGGDYACRHAEWNDVSVSDCVIPLQSTIDPEMTNIVVDCTLIASPTGNAKCAGWSYDSSNNSIVLASQVCDQINKQDAVRLDIVQGGPPCCCWSATALLRFVVADAGQDGG